MKGIEQKLTDRSFLSKKFEEHESNNCWWQEKRKYANCIEQISAGKSCTRK